MTDHVVKITHEPWVRFEGWEGEPLKEKRRSSVAVTIECDQCATVEEFVERHADLVEREGAPNYHES